MYALVCRVRVFRARRSSLSPHIPGVGGRCARVPGEPYECADYKFVGPTGPDCKSAMLYVCRLGERQTENERERQKERETETESVCVCALLSDMHC
jgi:hypothetical protein